MRLLLLLLLLHAVKLMSHLIQLLLLHDAMHSTDYAVARCLSVGTVPKWLNVSFSFFIVE